MKFEFEKVTVDFIKERVEKEEARVGKRVTHVRLNPEEWAEFMAGLDIRYCSAGQLGFQEYRIARLVPASFLSSSSCAYTLTLTVTPEK